MLRSTPALPAFIADIRTLFTMIVWVSINGTVSAVQRLERNSQKTHDVLVILLRMLGASCLGTSVAGFFSCWIAQVCELSVIAQGVENGCLGN